MSVYVAHVTSGYNTGQCYHQTYDNNFECIEGALKIPTLLLCPQPLQCEPLSQPLLWSCSQVVELGCFRLAKLCSKMCSCVCLEESSALKILPKGTMWTSSSPSLSLVASLVAESGFLSASTSRAPGPGEHTWGMTRGGMLGAGCRSGTPHEMMRPGLHCECQCQVLFCSS